MFLATKISEIFYFFSFLILFLYFLFVFYTENVAFGDFFVEKFENVSVKIKKNVIAVGNH